MKPAMEDIRVMERSVFGGRFWRRYTLAMRET